MKTLQILWLLISISITSAWCSDDLIVEARLIEIPGTMPPNDLYNYVYILKYKVIKVIQGKLDSKEILVGQYNPLQARNAIHDKMDSKVDGNTRYFKAGAKHTLTLTQPLTTIWNEAVEDEYFDDDSIRYFALKTDNTP